MRINIFPHLSRALSMQRYLNGLVAGMRKLYPHEIVVNTPGSLPAGEMGPWRKYIAYWFKAFSVRRGFNIILSERFSFLLHALPSRMSVIVCHDMVTLLNPNLPMFRKLRYKIILRIMARARIIVCISESTKNDLIRLNSFIQADKVSVIHNGIEDFWDEPLTHDPEGKMFSITRGAKYFLVVGTDAWNKNFQLIVAAMRTIERSDFKLVKVGPLSEQNHRLLRESGLSERLVLIENITDSELKWLYRNAVALVFPSLHEGFGWPPLEAMATGCPVIASSVSSVKEVCGAAAYAIDPQQPNDLKLGMELLLADEKAREKLIQDGKEQAKQFNWEKTAKEFVILLQNLQ